MKRLIYIIITIIAYASPTLAQERVAQHKPYIDLRPMHFGILVGAHMQDLELENVGPQNITDENGQTLQQTIVTDVDNWNPGFSVGVLAELRINANLAARFTPSMHFGGKHLVFRNITNPSPNDIKEQTQTLKTTYISFPVNIKFSAERFNNYRPYLTTGLNQVINLTSKSQDYVQLKRTDTFIEVGMGCDFYLPFFKLIPELKFCYGLSNAIDKSHLKGITDPMHLANANSINKGHSKMIVLTFYFE